jgi:hypothetical protein
LRFGRNYSHSLGVNNLAILPRSNCASENADEVNAAARCVTRRFDKPTYAVQESGTMGMKAKPSGVGALAALLFEQAVNTELAKSNTRSA